WKLAAQVHGWAPADLLDTYHAERHPVGQRLMTLTRAQEALARPGDHVTALRGLFVRLLAQEQTFRTIAEEITDVDLCYDMGVSSRTHPLLGRWAPNLVLQTDRDHSTVAELLSGGRGLLVDRSERPELRNLAGGWDDRIRLMATKYDDRPDNLDAMLV